MKPTPKAIIVTGLCGSGKTTLLGRLSTHNSIIFDSVMKNAQNDSPLFKDCRHRHAIRHALKEGRPLIISDIRFYDAEFREEFLQDLSDILMPKEIHWHSFLPDLSACHLNLLHRARQNPDSVPGNLRETNLAFYRIHTLPTGATLHHTRCMRPWSYPFKKLQWFFSQKLN